MFFIVFTVFLFYFSVSFTQFRCKLYQNLAKNQGYTTIDTDRFLSVLLLTKRKNQDHKSSPNQSLGPDLQALVVMVGCNICEQRLIEITNMLCCVYTVAQKTAPMFAHLSMIAFV